MAGRVYNPFLRFPRASLLLVAVLCLPWLACLPRFEFDAETRVLLGGDQRNLTAYEQVRKILGETEAVVISLEVTDLFSPAGLDVVRRVSDAFLSQPTVIAVHSLTHAVKPVRRGLSFDMVPLVSPEPTTGELGELRRFCLSHPLVRNLLVAADGRHTLVTVTFGQRAGTAGDRRALGALIEATLAPFRAAGLRARVLALPLIEEELRGTLARDLRLFLPLAGAVVIGVLWFTFRSWRLVVFVLMNQVFALALLPGLAVVTGARLNVFTLLLLPLLSGIHLTLLAHLLTARQRNLAAGQGSEEALASAVRLTWKPSVFATLTTVVALLSLAVSNIPQIRTFGLLGAAGLALVHLLTYGPTLALLALSGPRRAGTAAPGQGTLATHPAALEGLVAFTARRRRTILAVAALAVAIAALGLSRLRTDIRATEFLSPASPTRQALEELDRVWGGINVVPIAFDTGRPGGANDLGFLRYLESVHRHAESLPDLAGAYSYARLMAMINQVWEGGASDALRLPTSPLLVRLFVVALRSYEFPFLSGLTDGEFRTAQLVLRTRDLPADRYLALVNEVLAFAERERPEGVSVSAAAGIHSILEADRRILRSQLHSAGLTAGVIFVTLALLWRSWRLPLLSLGSNLLPVALVIALAALLALPLNSITVMVGAISLGIAVDDSIHFLTHWRECRRAGRSREAALRETLALKGRTLVWTSLILIGVCAVFWCSSFPPVRAFGLLSAAAFAAALASVLMLLPALLNRATDPQGKAP
ncbi:MAG: MMPL family transporter [Verrucomicrobia bacterium]|nr:MMPL family transporter [Verrucomicrobiota bacterium]